jgi:hypothetical protein
MQRRTQSQRDLSPVTPILGVGRLGGVRPIGLRRKPGAGLRVATVLPAPTFCDRRPFFREDDDHARQLSSKWKEGLLMALENLPRFDWE